MTARQIRKQLEKEGIKPKHIEDAGRNTVTISNDRIARKVGRLLGWGGYRAGWGSWILQKDFRIDPHMGTKAGREHY